MSVYLTFVGGRLYSIDQTFANVASYVRVGKHVAGERPPDWQGSLTYDLPDDGAGYVSAPNAMAWSTPDAHLLAYDERQCTDMHVRRVILDRAKAPACHWTKPRK